MKKSFKYALAIGIIKKVVLLIFLFSNYSFSQVQIQGAQPTYANPNPQPIKVQIQQNPADAYSNSFNAARNATSNSLKNASIRKANYAAKQAAEAEARAYNSERERAEAIEIADDPYNAIKYTSTRKFTIDKNLRNVWGIPKDFEIGVFKIPHKAIYTQEHLDYYKNTSSNYIKTEFYPPVPFYPSNMSRKQLNNIEKLFRAFEILKGAKHSVLNAIPAYFKIGEVQVDDLKTIKLSPARRLEVLGMTGYTIAAYFEDEFDKRIVEYYISTDAKKGVYNYGRIRYSGSKADGITFDDLDARRDYLRRVNESYIGDWLKLQ